MVKGMIFELNEEEATQSGRLMNPKKLPALNLWDRIEIIDVQLARTTTSTHKTSDLETTTQTDYHYDLICEACAIHPSGVKDRSYITRIKQSVLFREVSDGVYTAKMSRKES